MKRMPRVNDRDLLGRIGKIVATLRGISLYRRSRVSIGECRSGRGDR
jgi:hypothetical protein